jgi:hypothetical protein
MQMDSSEEAISARIKQLMKDRGLEHPDGRLNVTELHRLISQELKTREDGGKRTITRQTVSNWIAGRIKVEELPFLAKALGSEREYILFGSKRGEQLKKERQFLARVNEEELALLTAFREASKSGQRIIVKQAQSVAEEQPAPEATVHPMRRKEDKLKG